MGIEDSRSSRPNRHSQVSISGPDGVAAAASAALAMARSGVEVSFRGAYVLGGSDIHASATAIKRTELPAEPTDKPVTADSEAAVIPPIDQADVVARAVHSAVSRRDAPLDGGYGLAY